MRRLSLALIICFWYTVIMVIQQTIKIPADRRVHLDWTLPETASVGTATVILDFPTMPDEETLRRQREAIKKCWGIAKHIGFSSDDLIANRRKDLELEEAKRRRLYPQEYQQEDQK
jgi:hypothetical protein